MSISTPSPPMPSTELLVGGEQVISGYDVRAGRVVYVALSQRI